MASGSSKGFDFASDDILCSYEDYTNQENSNGSHSDSAIANNKEFHKSRMARTSVFPSSSYSPPDDLGNQDAIIAAVERSTKKYGDNIMRFLEGLSSRLSQLELYCYNLDKSIGEMRSDLARDHGESDMKLKFLEKHVQEVHRSVQILRDKQELADTQKELAKLQLAQKESSSGHNEERSSTPSSETKNDAVDLHGQQLALALPRQSAPQPAAAQPQMAPQPMSQPQPYYLPPPQLSNQYVQPDSQYRTQPPPPPPTQASQQQPQAQVHQMSQYQQQQQQWAQQQVQPQAPVQQPGVRPSSPQVYPPYLPSQPANPSPPEPIPNNMPYSSQAMTYAYGTPGRVAQPQQPPQHLKPGDSYAVGGPNNGYVMYDNEGGRTHFTQGGYPANPQQNIGGSMVARPPQQFSRGHPYNELMEKLVSMGYRGDHVMSVIQSLEERGQTVDFNAVLDMLNVHSSSGVSHQRGWSG